MKCRLGQKQEELEFEIGRLQGENAHIRAENRELNEVIFSMSNQLNSEKKIKLYEEIAGTRSGPQPNYQSTILAKVVEERENIINLRVNSF